MIRAVPAVGWGVGVDEMGRRGIFISLEGGEGSGKTTQLRRIGEYLRARGREVHAAREPGGTEVGEMIREILLTRASSLTARTELALYLASRAQLVDEVIRPKLDQGIDILCDRFADSSTAYQGGGRELGFEIVEDFNQWATAGLLPDLTFYFDVAPEVGLARRIARSEEQLDRMEREPLTFHARVRDSFRMIAERSMERFHVIEVVGHEEVVWDRVRAVLDESFATRWKSA